MKVNRKEIIEELKKLQSGENRDLDHIEADDIICKLLARLGYDDVVKEYEKVPKWYS